MIALIQHCLPRYWVTRLFGVLAQIRIGWIKNFFIRLFVCIYKVDLSQAQTPSIKAFENFNDFFTRKLKQGIRPIDKAQDAVVSPVDGFIYHFGETQENPMFHAKGFEFSLTDLLVNKSLANTLVEGQFFCLYLSPKDYHRVHMPITGKLLETIYVPGDFYSVDPKVLAKIPGIFAKNERLICKFQTKQGPMVIVLVGAMNVASIHTVWAGGVNLTRKGEIIKTNYENETIALKKGEELGYFQLGSTVMVFFPETQLTFCENISPNQHCLMGEKLASMA